MQFDKLELKHTEEIYGKLADVEYKTCQISVISLYCYVNKYDTQICITDDFFFIKQQRPETGICYFMPIGDKDKLESAIEELYRYNKETHGSDELILWGITDDMMEDFQKAASGFRVLSNETDRDWAEYIHTSQNLVDMKGKRFHAKKNAVNQFLRNNSEYMFEEITSGSVAAVVDFQKRLIKGIMKFETDEAAKKSLCLENEAIMRSFESFDALKLKGGVIKIDDEICAYCLGGAITDTVFDLTFEKALRNYNGIFQVLEQEMIKKVLSEFTYINREEDLGIPGLRFSKEKLRPDILLNKHILRLTK